MIEELLPSAAVAVEARADSPRAALPPEEEAAVAHAVEPRRREFATGRDCARGALERLGVRAQPIPTGANGEPCWPAGVVGSITHCDGYRAAAVARAGDLSSIGIDAEPNLPLPEGVLGDVALPEERLWLSELLVAQPAVCWDRLLFSAKESVYKAWFPLARRWLGFEDAVLTLGAGEGDFRARLLVPGPMVAGSELRELAGRWIVSDGLVATAIVHPARVDQEG